MLDSFPRIFHDWAVAGVDSFRRKVEYELERIEVVVEILKLRRALSENGITGEQSLLFFEPIAQMVGGVARRVNRSGRTEKSVSKKACVAIGGESLEMCALRFDSEWLVVVTDKSEVGESIGILRKTVFFKFGHVRHLNELSFVNG